MMLAHYLWQRTARGATADEGTWLAARDQAASGLGPADARHLAQQRGEYT